jgi:hypothetical protein
MNRIKGRFGRKGDRLVNLQSGNREGQKLGRGFCESICQGKPICCEPKRAEALESQLSGIRNKSSKFGHSFSQRPCSTMFYHVVLHGQCGEDSSHRRVAWLKNSGYNLACCMVMVMSVMISIFTSPGTMRDDARRCEICQAGIVSHAGGEITQE